jgi:hypothetical protein
MVFGIPYCWTNHVCVTGPTVFTQWLRCTCRRREAGGEVHAFTYKSVCEYVYVQDHIQYVCTCIFISIIWRGCVCVIYIYIIIYIHVYTLYTLCIRFVYTSYTMCIHQYMICVSVCVQWCTDMHECTCICVVRIYPITCPRTYIWVRYMWKSVLIILYIYMVPCLVFTAPPSPTYGM